MITSSAHAEIREMRYRNLSLYPYSCKLRSSSIFGHVLVGPQGAFKFIKVICGYSFYRACQYFFHVGDEGVNCFYSSESEPISNIEGQNIYIQFIILLKPGKQV